MDWFQLVVLALVQGLTEFLPVSSSAHLILVPVVFGWDDQGLAFDVAVHLGTLLAVTLYFRHELLQMLVAWLGSLRGAGLNSDARLAWGVLFGVVPAGLCGLLFKDYISTHLRSAMVIAVATLVFGVLLWVADKWGARSRDEHQIAWTDVLVIGVFQALALVPGTSRSGITITVGLLMGLTREAAARFSFLLSVPIILLSGALVTRDLLASPVAVNWTDLLLGTGIAAISAFLCIHYFLILLQRVGMLPFVVYRLLLGVVLLVLFV